MKGWFDEFLTKTSISIPLSNGGYVPGISDALTPGSKNQYFIQFCMKKNNFQLGMQTTYQSKEYNAFLNHEFLLRIEVNFCTILCHK